MSILEYVDWFNNRRLHESLGDIPPVEFEADWAATTPISGDPQVTVTPPRASEGLTTPRPGLDQAETGVPVCDQVEINAEQLARNGFEDEPSLAKTATELSVDETSQLVSLPLGF